MDVKPCNIYRAGSAKYYRDALAMIAEIAEGYDGCDPTNTRKMRYLVDTLSKTAQDALDHKPMYYKLVKGER